MLDLSIAEQKLVVFAREEFGEFITQFLLAGLGKEEMVQSHLFTITTISSEGTEEKHLIQVLADERPDIATCCPRQREPLVLLALLRLLATFNEGTSASSVYTHEGIINLLGWKNNSESNLIIDDAIGRYFDLSYEPIINENELSRKRLLFLKSRERIIVGYRLDDDLIEEVQYEKTIRRVDFNVDFMKRLKARALFSFDWNSVRSITPAL